jgi:hypothetical protein
VGGEQAVLIDVSSRVTAAQEKGYELFRPGPSGTPRADPEAVLPGAGIEAAGWKALDPTKLDGLNVGLVKYADIRLDKTREVGELFAAERTSGSTKFFFIWVPRPVVSAIRSGHPPSELQFHVLFHPPTWESCYVRTPYWDGTCPNWRPNIEAERDVCVADMDKQPIYVRLGLRYTNQYSRAIAQHLVALRSREPLIVYITPVATAHDFADIVKTSALLALLRDVANFITARITDGKQNEYSGALGKLMLSGYSRSGTRLAAIMNQLSPSDVFFSRHLSQINAFDINLGDTQSEKEAAFNPLWDRLVQWKASMNRNARACIYTAYRYHADHVLRNSRGAMSLVSKFNLEAPGWTDEGLRKERGQPRGEAMEAYDSDASLSLIHLPVGFASVYLGAVANPRGYRPMPPGNGHNWFLRALMTHAVAHADPAMFGPPR